MQENEGIFFSLVNKGGKMTFVKEIFFGKTWSIISKENNLMDLNYSM